MDKIQELKEKYGKVYAITIEVETEDADEITFHFKKPTGRDYDRFIKEASKKPSQAFKNIAISCVVDEDKEEYLNTAEELPGIHSSFAQQLLKLLGVSDNVNFKRL